jgi:hypothetical protein
MTRSLDRMDRFVKAPGVCTMLFASYFLGGFECTTGFNREGDWIDLVEETWHLRHADAD